MTPNPHDNAPGLADDALLAPFRERNDPVLTTDEVVDSVPFGRGAAREALDRLNEAGTIERKAVGDDAVWWLPGYTETERGRAPMAGSHPDSSGLPRNVETAIHTLESIDERERSAIYAACHFLHSDGPVDETTLKERVYPEQSASYSDETEWWDECIRPAFDALPGVEFADGEWRLG
ncbi:hypothetical protein [Halorussus halophilus]|uniref:hypothetical protein n=1 Tax=Halorussus halophilus TaxID=2650975 RepID=UPI00130171C0|nr:hypothetical protein [Halorussus halophilus]